MRLTRTKPTGRTWLVALGILLGYWLLAVSVTPRLGATFDEPGHITSGYAYWKFGDYRINAENGILATRAAALPLVNLDVRFPPRDTLAWQQPNTRALAGSFFFELGNDFRVLLARPRFISALLGAGLLALIWLWSRRLFGVTAGWLALGVAALSPTLLAHGGLATSDIVVTTCLFAALTAFWRLWHAITWPRLALAGLAAGATLLAKTSGVLLLPLLAAMSVIRLLRPAALWWRLGRPRLIRGRAAIAGALLGTLGAAAVFSVVLIWTAYQFRYDAAPATPGQPRGFDPPWETVLAGAPHVPAAGSAAAGLIESGVARPAPTLLARTIQSLRDTHALPEAYLWSIAFTFQASRARPSFLCGEASTTGSRWFFPVAFLLKTTPAELLLFALGVGGAIMLWRRPPTPDPRRRVSGSAVAVEVTRPEMPTKRSAGLVTSAATCDGTPAHPLRARARRLYRAAPLLVLFAGYWLVAINTPLNIGHRHLLPAYPVLFVFAGGAALWLNAHRRGLVVGILTLAAIAQVADSFAARPFYLAYFTPTARAHPWQYLVDSSYDWGQGLPDFERWLAAKTARGDTAPVFLSYFGSDSPRARQLAVTRVADWRDDTGPRSYPAPLRGGWYAISATHYQRVYLGVSGPWSDAYEQRYQELKQSLPRDNAAASRLSAAERDAWLRNAMLLEILQFGRLCHYLGDAAPVEVVGSSLLIFQLSDEEIRAIIGAPLTELDALRGRRMRAR